MQALPPFETWEAEATDSVLSDPLWRMTAYRLAAYAAECGWQDARALQRNSVTRGVATQLYEALGSITANLAEGYSRSSGLDGARIFEYALGSAREARAWYYVARPVLGNAVVSVRSAILDRVCQLLLVAIPKERKRRVRPSP